MIKIILTGLRTLLCDRFEWSLLYNLLGLGTNENTVRYHR